MKYSDFVLTRYDADDGKLFDWKEPRYEDIVDENGKVVDKIEQHLFVKTLFIGGTDSIENYIEVDANGEIIELNAPVDATDADYVAALAELGVE